NFKCFQAQELTSRPLTVLSGVNGAGKSTIIQALLLMRTALQQHVQGMKELPLNGPHGLALGQVMDILPHNMENVPVVLGLSQEASDLQITLTGQSPGARYLGMDVIEQGDFSTSPMHGKGFEWFTFLSANRTGPQDYQPMQSTSPEFLEMGENGQFVAEILEAMGQKRVDPRRSHTNNPDGLFHVQVGHWLNQLLPGWAVKVERSPNFDVLGLRFKKQQHFGDEWLRPTNTGFGITYAFPILVAALAMQAGGVLIIDSPEAHLHPAGQSAMGQFLAHMAAGGVQIFLETHSDHIINGIRLAVLDDRHPLQKEQLIIHHLENTPDGTVVHEIGINERGGLTQHPADFFDQAEKDLANIVRRRFPTQGNN
ncbi:MAG: DUF3696 domain-containing protein, partial [Magnetococcales bacterium]|nr:DUF3696 domain-containing protein [Magnetococcales bacterium]